MNDEQQQLIALLNQAISPDLGPRNEALKALD
jgi:hypothetical protein